MAGAARPRDPHRRRPAQRRRTPRRRRAAARRRDGGAPAARRHRGPGVLGRVAERPAVRHAAVLRPAPGALPRAQRRGRRRDRPGAPGGVLVHCAGGRDRSGMTAMLVLALAGVTPAAIADDYARSRDADPAQDELLSAFLRERGTTGRELILELLRT